MGIRLNILANPAFRLRLDTPEPVGGGAVPASRIVLPDRQAGTPPRVETVPAGRTAAGFAVATAVPQQNRLNLNPAGEGAPTAELMAPQAAEAAVERPEEENAAPARRLRDFRFLTAAESARERDLEMRLDRLERELETAANRLRSGGSFLVRIDAQLDRARLERDLEQIQTEIGRLRLSRVFGGAIAGVGAPESAPATREIASIEAQAGAPDRAPGLNLLA
jgi:hypothetical protein